MDNGQKMQHICLCFVQAFQFPITHTHVLQLNIQVSFSGHLAFHTVIYLIAENYGSAHIWGSQG